MFSNFRKKYPVIVTAPSILCPVSRYRDPACIRRLRKWRFRHFLKRIYKDARMDEFNQSALDEYWETLREMATADLNCQKIAHEQEIREYLSQAEIEATLLEGMVPAIEKELERYEEELRILEEHTYKWSFQ